MYSFPNFEPFCCSMFSSNCCFLTCIQISQEAGKAVWYSHLLKNFTQFVVIYTVKWCDLHSKMLKVKEESENVCLKLNIQKTKIMASGPITSWEVDGETVTDFILRGSQITADGDYSREMKRCLLLGRKAMTNLNSILKSRNITLLTKVCLVKAMVFPVVMYGCESWTIKKAERQRIWCFWTVVLEKTLESPLDCKEIQLVHPKGDQSWIFIGRTDAEVETPIVWPPDSKNWLIGKDADAREDWRWEEKGTIGDGIVGWHHWFDGHEFEQTPGAGDG